ncbi:MAG: hypothetical protein IPI19_18465 [Ignavibacteriales bacterium]|nr:hypothetical protein [Ignavibacteriales bacterium]
MHRELLHRVKNSFNLIKSLMYLEREKLDNKEASKILENLEMRIGTLSKNVFFAKYKRHIPENKFGRIFKSNNHFVGRVVY